MSKLSNFLGKGKEYKIGVNKLEIYPLKLKNIDLVASMDSNNAKHNSEMMKKLIEVTLKDAVPDASDEEIQNFSVTHFKEITEAIMDVNGLAPVKSISPHVRSLLMCQSMLDDPSKQPGDIADEIDKLMTPQILNRFRSLINEVLNNNA